MTNRWYQAPLTWSAFGVAYLMVFFASSTVPTPLWWYMPVERRFVFDVHPMGLGMDFYGRVALSLVGGCVGAVIGLILHAKLPSHRRVQVDQLLLVWLLGIAIFTSGLYVHLLTSRQPKPLPLPADYVAR